jgi:hypothetical protein
VDTYEIYDKIQMAVDPVHLNAWNDEVIKLVHADLDIIEYKNKNAGYFQSSITW